MMEPHKGEESGEMYSSDNQGEYGTDAGTSSFTVQGLSDVLSTLDTGVMEVTKVQLPGREFALQLEVMMADCPGHPNPPTFSWNTGMVMHVLKSDPTLQDLEHVQVGGPSMAYLFFFNKQDCRGLSLKAAQAMRTHVGDAFTQWISHSAHFIMNPLPLAEGWCCMVTVLEWCRHRLRTEFEPQAVQSLAMSESDSTPQLVGSAPLSAMRVGPADEARGVHGNRTASTRPHGRPPKAKPIREGENLPPSSPDQGGADSDGYSTASEAVSDQHRRRRQRNEKCLVPACLDMLIFKSTDPNADVKYTVWRFDIQGWMDQYDEVSMMLHIYSSLQEYPGKWVYSLDEGRNIMVRELLEGMDVTFGNLHDYDSMIRSLYKIQQKEARSVEEHVLRIHEAVAVIHCAHPDHVSDQGKNLQQDRFYHGLLPSLHDVLSFTMADLPKRDQANTSFDTLYTLARKLEVRQPPRSQKSHSWSIDLHRDKYRRYSVPAGRVATLEEDKLFLPDPKSHELEMPEFDQIEGLSMHMTQAMDHFQYGEHKCFVCGTSDHFARDFPH